MLKYIQKKNTVIQTESSNFGPFAIQQKTNSSKTNPS